MTGSYLALIVEGLVAMLLVATIVYCIVVSRKLNNLKADQERLGDIVQELNQATQHAETAIGGLRATVDTANRDLGTRLDAADEIETKLANSMAEAGGVLSKLSAISQAARSRRDGQQTQTHSARAELWPNLRLSSLAAADRAGAGQARPAPSKKTGKDVA